MRMRSVCADAGETTASVEVQASADAQSAPTALLHP